VVKHRGDISNVVLEGITVRGRIAASSAAQADGNAPPRAQFSKLGSHVIVGGSESAGDEDNGGQGRRGNRAVVQIMESHGAVARPSVFNGHGATPSLRDLAA
jgi:hypothetical protein